MEHHERLNQLFDFFREIDKEKMIQRQTYLTDGSRKEDDAEHAWHMAIMTVLLSEYANEEIDVLKTVTMLLIHDIVEIDAGDTYAYDTQGQKTQRAREEKAAARIFGMLPADSQKSSWIYGKSSSPVIHRKQDLRVPWTASSRLF